MTISATMRSPSTPTENGDADDQRTRLGVGAGLGAVWMISTALAMILMVGLAVDRSDRVLANSAQNVAQAARAGGQQLKEPPPFAVRARSWTQERPSWPRTHRGRARVHRDGHRRGGTRVVTDTSTTYTTKFLSIIGITNLTVTGHAEVEVNRAVAEVAQ